MLALTLPRRARSGDLSGGKTYPRAILVDEHGQALAASALEAGTSYIFHYPFVATPCFLIDLGMAVKPGRPLETESGQRYHWPGGAGASSSIVAFSAICAHKMTHPAKAVSFINYRPGKVRYVDNARQPATGSEVIYCCSESSVYDARDGARVLGGPATQPLAAIALDYDPEADTLAATGTFGGEMFERFFAKFSNRLQLEYGVTDVSAGVGAATVVRHMDEFSRSRVFC
jgi:Rieske Fe-S protein